ncbi:MAG: hypothetical protein JST98_11140 [Bacteroidetes bacterium]|nr:hypothetical protein [Bacteroidota bacterium]
MKTYAVRAKSKKAEALIEQLVALGVIEAEAMKKTVRAPGRCTGRDPFPGHG